MGFLPIGNSNKNNFQGVFNGNNYSILELYINRPNTDRVGLFGQIYSAKISNVGLSDIDITGQWVNR